MKKLTSLAISCLLLVGTAACNNPAKTSTEAPDSTTTVTNVTDSGATQAARNDAQSEVRRRQLNADIRAREQRQTWAGDGAPRNPRDVASEVRSKLEANLPNSHLAVDARSDGIVSISGTVANSQQFAKIGPLAREINGVKGVEMKVTIAQKKINSRF